MITSLREFIPLIELALISTLLISYLSKGLYKSQSTSSIRLITLLALFIFLLLPLDAIFSGNLPWKLPLIAYVRAATGDLSISTLLLCLVGLGHFKKIQINTNFVFLIGICALVFYPLALGVSMIDPYAWGYGSIIFISSVTLFAGLFIWRHSLLEGVVISIAMIAWSFQWHESTNLWDYLIDPFLGVWAIIYSIRIFIRSKSSIY